MSRRLRFALALAVSLAAALPGASAAAPGGGADAAPELSPAAPLEPTVAKAIRPFPAPAAAPGDDDGKRAGAAVPGGGSSPGVQVVLSEGFEGVFPSGAWSAFDNNGATGGQVYWDDTNYRRYAGTWSAGCADGGANASPPGGNYSNSMDSWMVYGPFSLADATAATLSFRYWNRSETNFDFFKFLVSIDGSTFYGFQTSGDSGGWQGVLQDLDAIPSLGKVTGQPAVWIAFAFATDSSVTYEGAYVDEVLVQKTVASGPPDIRVDPLTLQLTQSPTNRPIYVELDWMADGTHSHRPSQAVVDRIVETFAAAGFDLHLDVSNALPHQAEVAITGTPSTSPAVQAILAANFNHAADSRYYYSLWGHNYSYNGTATTSSGIADLPGRVHLVTLGSFSGQTGTFSNQVGTFIHEFGHNLGQRHGGADHENWKPNYLSVMNYHYQLAGLGPSLLALGFASSAAGFDDFSYSHGLAPGLNEASLDERFGIGLGRAVDWNCDGLFTAGLAKDIQDFNPCFAAGGMSVISDFDNWSNVGPQIRTSTAGVAPEAPPEVALCITPEEQRPLQEKIDRLRAVGLLPADGPGPPRAVAAPGDAGRSFFVYNDGGGALTVSSLALDVPASWIRWAPQAPFTIPPGGSQEVLVSVDFGHAPAGQTTRRLLIGSNDPDESPYPGGVNLLVTRAGAACYALTRAHTGSGADPVASPAASADCPAGQYHAGETIQLTASPSPGSEVGGWTGTLVDSSNSVQNALVMPAAAQTVTVRYQAIVANPALDFYTVAPCRAVDTRTSSPLVSQVPRSFPVAGVCGIPAGAKAVSANLTVVQPSNLGHVTLWPADLAQPPVSSINFAAGRARANNALLRLATDGSGSVSASAFVLGGGSVHLLIDVNGYYQ